MKALIATLIFLFSISVFSADYSAESKSIGSAEMKKDGSIVLLLRAKSEDGIVGHTVFEYLPTDKDYKKILKHLGGLKPGETKLVPPWPENENL